MTWATRCGLDFDHEPHYFMTNCYSELGQIEAWCSGKAVREHE